DALVVAGCFGLPAAHRPAPASPVPSRPARPRVGLGHEIECSRDWNKPFRSDNLGTEDFVPVVGSGARAVEEMHETGETTEDRMSSAAVTTNTAHGPLSTPAGDA